MPETLHGPTVLDGKATARGIRQELAQIVNTRRQNGEKVPHLAALLIGDDAASESYVNYKVKDCKEVGFQSTLLREPGSISEKRLLHLVAELNNDSDIDGFIVQLPLPKQINTQKVIMAIDPLKDVDGFHPVNVGKMTLGLEGFLPATPYGIIELLKRNDISIAGRHCVVLGRSNIVGSPLSVLLSRNSDFGNATVTLCHSRTKNLEAMTRQADVLVAALGKPGFIKAHMLKQNAVVIDVGTTRVSDSSKTSGFALKGDVSYEDVFHKVSAITPVPGGVGPMTRVALLLNTLKASALKLKQPS